MWSSDRTRKSAAAARRPLRGGRDAPPRALLGGCVGLALALLAGCGFHLAGGQPLPKVLARPYLSEKDPYTQFARELEGRLKGAGAQIVQVRADSSATIEVTRDLIEQRTLAVSARNIPTDYELTYTVTFRVHGADAELLPEQTVSVTKDYSFQETELLAKENESDILRAQMARDLAAIVMRRLSRL
jgi:LPS-assembly lipoprotein